MSIDILIIDDEKSIRTGLTLILKKKYSVAAAENGKQAMEIFVKEDPDIILLDIGLPDMNGIEVLKRMKSIKNDVMVIMVTAVEDIKSIVKAIKAGAYDYLVKPAGKTEIFLTIKNALKSKHLKDQIQSIQKPLMEKYKFNFIYQDKQILKIMNTANKISKSTDTPVLIIGESGTGKSMLAKTIHYNGSMNPGPFVIVNCGAIAKDLIESELFGYEGGAFTGAKAKGKKGRFEEAAGGTLFLDEIGAMPVSAQAKLLNVLEERTFFRVGGTKPISLSARVISATNADIEKSIINGEFRKDLFYRINTVTLEIPPLCSRPDDILPLINYFMNLYNQKFNKHFSTIASDTQDILLKYNWPGNVRELKNTMERIILIEDGDTILPEHLPFSIKPEDSIEPEEIKEKQGRFDIEKVRETYHEKLKLVINDALDHTQNNIPKAAKLLNLPLHKLRYQIKKLGIKTHR